MNRFISVCVVFFGVFLFTTSTTSAASGLVRSVQSSTVYYLDNDGVRHVFPTQSVYQSWYGDSFDEVSVVSNSVLLAAPLGKNITMRPGTSLITTPTTPDVYAVEQGGVLRKIVSEEVARAIYGDDWNALVVELPEVFFSDYLQGEDVRYAYPVPDNLVYHVAEMDMYYYKDNGVLQPFASEADVYANGFLSQHIIEGRLNYLTRETPLKGYSAWLNYPAALPITSTADCRNDELKAAFIYLSNTDNVTVFNQNVATLQHLQSKVEDRYTWATDGFSSIDTSYPLVTADVTEYTTLLRNDGLLAVKSELINIFYDAHPDEFDFIFVWTDFAIPQVVEGEIAHFTSVSNHVRGIGRTVFDSSAKFGSSGRLKGVITMGPVGKYSITAQDNEDHVLNIMLHEIGHQWGSYLTFGDTEMASSALLDENKYHWSYYLDMISPLGGTGWIDEGNGRFRSGLSTYSRPNMRKFSSLDLYTMGHIPYQFFDDEIGYIVPDVAGTEGVVILGERHTVDIEEIRAVHGTVRCTL